MNLPLAEFLASSKCSIQPSVSSKVHVVLGNEACDLDSVVSAIVYAYCLYKVTPKECKTGTSDTVVVPVLNIPREDYRLRTEITYTLERFGINSTELIFIDEVDLKAMKDHGKLLVTLVDHNIIPAHQAFLKDVLFEIIDHHKDESPTSPNYVKTIEPVGSCSTLVAEKVLQKAPDILDEQVIISLLVAAILLDTVNLDPRAGRMTDKDVAVVDQLKKYSKSDFHSEELYLAVSKAKFDTSSLNSMEILRKDYKAVPRNPKSHLSIGISSIGLSLESFLTNENIARDLQEFTKLKGLSVLVVMVMYFHSMDGPPIRQIMICGEDQDGIRRLSDFLKEKSELQLVAKNCTLSKGVCFSYDQLNVKASRKLVFPLVMECLNS